MSKTGLAWQVLAFLCGCAVSCSSFRAVGLQHKLQHSEPGASGAIAGVFGRVYHFVPAGKDQGIAGSKNDPGFCFDRYRSLDRDQLFSGIGSITSTGQGGVAYLAHIGGFVAGILLTFLFRGRQPALPGR